MSIGRSRANDVVLDDPELSRRHALLERDDEHSDWRLVDCGSLNGTLLNARPVTEPQVLRAGDVVVLGGWRAVVGEGSIPSAGRIQLPRVTDGTMVAVSTPAGPLRTARPLLAAARALLVDRPVVETLTELLAIGIADGRADRGLVGLVDDSGALDLLARYPEGEDAPPRISRSVLDRVLDQREAVICEDVLLDEELRDAQTIADFGVCSVLCAPLGSPAAPRGVLYLDSLGQRARFDPSHLELASVLAGFAGFALEADAARRERERQRAIEAQLRAAAEIQARLMPPERPPAPPGFAAAGYHVASQSVGGDLYDFFEWNGGYGVMIADVAGKGLSAALVGAHLHAQWKALLASGAPPSEWLERLNSSLVPALPPNRFVTLAFALVDPDERLLFASAGHNESILARHDGVELLGSTGPVLGLLDGAPFALTERRLRPGEALVVYSDGVTDQQSRRGEMFTLERLVDAVEGAGVAEPAALLDAVRGRLEEHARGADRDDDTTVAILGRA